MSNENALTAVADSGAIYELQDGYIFRRGEPKILGRASEAPEAIGTGWYQLAARPYDEPSVMGFRGTWSALLAAVEVLDARRVAESGNAKEA